MSNFIIDTMEWSFSRINSFENCPYGWYLHYVQAEESLPSFYGEYGGFCHKVLEKYEKGQLDVFSISQFYEDNYSSYVTTEAPFNLYSDIGFKYYQRGKEYFETIDLGLDDYNILGVEKECHFHVGDYPMVGYIDLLLQNRKNGEITIADHKSSSIKILKNGNISKKDQKHFDEFKKQLYLYSIPVIEEYGHVDLLKWNLFKDGTEIEIPFSKIEFKDTKEWAVNCIEKIRCEADWTPKNSIDNTTQTVKHDYFCQNICDVRDRCRFSGWKPPYEPEGELQW